MGYGHLDGATTVRIFRSIQRVQRTRFHTLLFIILSLFVRAKNANQTKK